MQAGEVLYQSVLLQKKGQTILCSVCQLLEQSKTNHLQCVFEARWKPYCPFHLKPWAADLGKDMDAREQILCLLLLPLKHWARGICTRQESITASHFDTYTPSHKSLLFMIYVSGVKFILCETLAKSSLISFQVLCKSKRSDAPRRTYSICFTTHMCALLITLQSQR